MNRRELLLAGGASALLIPTALHAEEPTAWNGFFATRAARDNRHAELAMDWIAKQIETGEIFVGTEVRLLDTWVILEEPRFLIEAGQPVWNYMVGHTDEPGLSISVWSRGQRIGAARVASDYGSCITPLVDQGYSIRTICISYEDEKRLDAAGVKFRRDLPWFLKVETPALDHRPPRV